MVTIFAVPKPFRDHIALIQSNAIRSWLALRPECEVILFGDDHGVGEAAKQHGVQHVARIAKNEYGTPLLDDVFLKAQTTAKYPTLCYVNADILLLSDFLPAVERVREEKPRFLMVGSRWDVEMNRTVPFADGESEGEIRDLVLKTGTPRSPEWIDYFVFNRGLFTDLLPFALGRAAFDNWLLWRATVGGAALVDASSEVLAVHQNHDYAHHKQGQKGVWEGPEARRNRELMETWDHCYFLTDASHRLTPSGLRRNRAAEHRRRRLNRSALFQRGRRVRLALLALTYPLRNKLGLRRARFEPLAKLLRRESEH